MLQKKFIIILVSLFVAAAMSLVAQPADVPPADPGITPPPRPASAPAAALGLEAGATPAAPPQAAPGAPAAPAAPQEQAAPVALTPTPTPVVFENIPVNTLWERYQEAVKQIEAGQDEGVDALLRLFSSDDEKWTRANMPLLVDLLSSGTIATSSVAEKRLFVAEALLRNMPRRIAGQPKFYRPVGSPYGVAVVTDDSSGRPVEYVTLLYQEAGRWVLYHPFFIRDFIWMPQLAFYKKLRKLPNAPEELEYLRSGFAPFMQWAQSYFSYCGYKVGEDSRGKPSTATGATRR